MARTALDPKFNLNVRFDKDNKAITNALEVIENNYDVKNEVDSRNRAIQDLFEEGFIVKDPRGTRKLSSKRLFQSVWKMAQRMKPLDFSIHRSSNLGDGKVPAEVMEKVVTGGVSTVMDEGGYISSLREKQGMFFNLLMYGDGFDYVGANPEDGPPIVFNPVSTSNIYVDNYATGIRAKGWGRNATKVVAIFSYSWAEFVAMFPKMKSKAGLGRIPRQFIEEDELEREKDFGVYNQEEDIIEVAYAYDINAKNYVVFAGQACTKILELKGDDYPFILNEEPYIPILQFLCFPASEGFFNYGVGNIIFDLAILSRRLLNMEIGHIEDNTYPIELVNVPQGEVTKFFQKLKLANEMRTAGKKGFVAMEYDPNAPNQNAVNSQTLLTQNLFQEWQIMFDRLDRELQRLGIPLDEIDRGATVTATQILAEEESANATIKQIMEYNASESKFAVELTMQFIKEFISTDDETPLNMTTSVRLPEGGELNTAGITMGMVADELNKNDYFVRVNARTGAYPSNVLRVAQLSRALQLATPGSPAQVQITGDIAKSLDIDIPGEQFLPQQQVAGPTKGEVAAQGEALPTGTDRLTTVPGKEEQVPVL